MNKGEAVALAQQALEDCPVLGDHVLRLYGTVVETDRAWIFRYQSSKWIRTREREDAILGAGPLYIDKRSGKYYFLPTYASPDQVIQDLERGLDMKHGS